MSISGLYNIYGDRIYNVGNTSFPDIYERARHQVDLQLTKSFFKKKLEAKIGVSDVFANDLVFYMDYNKTSSYEAGDDVSVFRFKMPRIITFSLGYKF
jgi:hypothetical protein